MFLREMSPAANSVEKRMFSQASNKSVRKLVHDV